MASLGPPASKKVLADLVKRGLVKKNLLDERMGNLETVSGTKRPNYSNEQGDRSNIEVSNLSLDPSVMHLGLNLLKNGDFRTGSGKSKRLRILLS